VTGVNLPDIGPYLEVIDRYLAGELPAEPFTAAFMTMSKNERRLLGEPLGPVLSATFLDCDEYVDDPRLRTGGPYEIDGPELRCRVAAAREKLRDLVGH
jgi:Bacterial self-protective colicin-like immunity